MDAIAVESANSSFANSVKKLALTLAVQAEIEGMKAENEGFRILNMAPACDRYMFDKKAKELREIASR